MGILISMHNDSHHDEGQSLVLHGVKTFASVLGDPTEWDTRSFTFVNDVTSGEVQKVELLPEMFN
jgi:hypothetical protein